LTAFWKKHQYQHQGNVLDGYLNSRLSVGCTPLRCTKRTGRCGFSLKRFTQVLRMRSFCSVISKKRQQHRA